MFREELAEARAQLDELEQGKPGPRHSYIAMEHIADPDLSAMLRHQGLLPARMVMRIVSHVAAALAVGLAQQLVHRDIKPSNILLTREGVAKLVDFGLARSHEVRIDHGAVVGTLGYMSPEHIERPLEAARAVSSLVMWMLQLDPARRPRDYDTIIAAAHEAAAASRDRGEGSRQGRKALGATTTHLPSTTNRPIQRPPTPRKRLSDRPLDSLTLGLRRASVGTNRGVMQLPAPITYLMESFFLEEI